MQVAEPIEKGVCVKHSGTLLITDYTAVESALFDLFTSDSPHFKRDLDKRKGNALSLRSHAPDISAHQ